MKIISLGAGVQSSTLFLMSCYGEIEKADAAIFADTQDEPKSVYKYLDWLESEGRKHGIPVYNVTDGKLSNEFIEKQNGKRKSGIDIPVYVKFEDGSSGIAGRNCTRAYKLAPIRRKARELMKEAGEKEIEMWIGISTDEIQRMKDSPVKYIKNRWPLIELRMTRNDCRSWFNNVGGRQPPRSACVYCPFKKHSEWKQLKKEEPQEFEKAVEFDKQIRRYHKHSGKEFFVHKAMLPLEEAVMVDDDQAEFGFLGECEGMCGI